MRTLITLALSAILILPTHGQVSEVKNQVQAVTVKGNAYEQALTTESDNECLVLLTVYNNKKDEETIYEFNAADLNEQAVSFDTRKNEVSVTADTERKRDLVRVYEDGQIKGYQDEVPILAPGIQEARELVEAMKEMIQQCQQQTVSVDMEGKSAVELLSYLENNVREINQDDTQLSQIISRDTDKSALITYQRIDQQDGEELGVRSKPS